MAQLTDDCFAFSGPLLPIAEAERMIGERVSAVAGIETVGDVPPRAGIGLGLLEPGPIVTATVPPMTPAVP